MHWPDYHPRHKKSSAWRGVGILLILLVSLLLAGDLNGWWRITSAPDPQASAAAEDNVEGESAVVIPPTAVPLRPTRTPQTIIEGAAAAPNFELPDLFDDMSSVALSDYGGHPVILNFWASWCVPCREEMPALENAYQKYKDEGLVILGVNQLYVDDRTAAREFVLELQLTFPHVADETGQVSERNYQVVGLPTSVFLTPDGEIAHVQIGQMSDRQIDTFGQRLVTGERLTSTR